MAFQNVRIQIGLFAAADGLDEIGFVVLSTVEGLDPLAIFVVRDGADNVTAFTLDHLVDALAFVFIHFFTARGVGKTANFEDQQ